MKFYVSYKMLWAGKVVKSDIIEVEALDDFRARRTAEAELLKMNRRAQILLEEVVPA